MEEMGKIKLLFIAGFGPIVREPTASRKLYNQTLGIGFKEENGGYLHTEALQRSLCGPFRKVAESCFGKDAWPTEIPAPQAWLEFDVDDVAKATLDRSARSSNARKEQKGTVGPDCQPFHHPRRVVGRNHVHSLDARRNIAWLFGRRSSLDWCRPCSGSRRAIQQTTFPPFA
jgi:hypothetical protein